ncbi:MAG: hypothetical protein K2X64_11825 [Rhodocyclaceae bacterium]|nr:hypothetical protein [Rhodocyclaceae bacterium]
MNQHPRHKPSARRISVMMASATLFLSGCVTTGYHDQVSGSLNAAKSGAVDVALSNLEQSNPGKDKDLLYFLEKGELLRMKGSYPESRESWLQADGKVREWEDAVRTDPGKLAGDIGSYLINDTTRRYDGRDYEKVMLSVRIALDHLALGDWGAARTEVKKMHEREAIIADFRAKELDNAKKQASDKGLQVTSYKDLNGYPVETLDAPEVRSLKNAYESAFANYLAGFVYEALGEPSLAAAGYRKAIEMRPGEKILEESLKGLDQRAGQVRGRKETGVDTLIVVESGNAPAIRSRTLPIPLPIPSRGGLQVVMTPLSWPVVEPVGLDGLINTVNLDNKPLPISLITNVDHMARRAISDEMPSIILRSSIRAIAKGAAQKAVQDNASSAGMFGAVLSIGASVAAVVSEKADERSWRSLPAFYSVGRVVLTPGTHTLTLNTTGGTLTREIQVSGKHAVVVVRGTGNSLYLAQTPYTPAPSPVVTAPEPAIKPVARKKPAEPIKPLAKEGTK